MKKILFTMVLMVVLCFGLVVAEDIEVTCGDDFDLQLGDVAHLGDESLYVELFYYSTAEAYEAGSAFPEGDYAFLVFVDSSGEEFRYPMEESRSLFLESYLYNVNRVTLNELVVVEEAEFNQFSGQRSNIFSGVATFVLDCQNSEIAGQVPTRSFFRAAGEDSGVAWYWWCLGVVGLLVLVGLVWYCVKECQCKAKPKKRKRKKK